MKRASLIIASALMFAAPVAQAADMALKAPPPAPAVDPWAGWYLGVNIGGSWGRAADTTTYGAPPVLFAATSSHLDGVIGGGQVGYNWQFAPAWVAGVEADFDGADIEGKATTTANTFTGSVGSKLDWFGTVRGRVGYLVTPTALLYATGGWAYGHTTSSANATALGLSALASTGTDQNGWTVGGGLEYALNPWLSVKTEYLYLDLGTNTVASGALAAVPFSLSEKTTVHTVKLGINLKLGGWGAGWGL